MVYKINKNMAEVFKKPDGYKNINHSSTIKIDQKIESPIYIKGKKKDYFSCDSIPDRILFTS